MNYMCSFIRHHSPFQAQSSPFKKRMNKVVVINSILLAILFPVSMFIEIFGYVELFDLHWQVIIRVALFLMAMFLVGLLPKTMQRVLLWFLLVIIGCLFLFQIVFTLLWWYTGLPPWKLVSNPWVQ